MVSKQETFDTVARGLLEQGKKSTGDRAVWGGSRCMFRNNAGLKCALGFLIEDHEYRLSMETDAHGTLMHLVDKGHDRDLMTSLLQIHDKTPVDMWEIELARLAGLEKLSLAVLYDRHGHNVVQRALSSWSPTSWDFFKKSTKQPSVFDKPLTVPLTAKKDKFPPDDWTEWTKSLDEKFGVAKGKNYSAEFLAKFHEEHGPSLTEQLVGIDHLLDAQLAIHKVNSMPWIPPHQQKQVKWAKAIVDY